MRRRQRHGFFPFHTFASSLELHTSSIGVWPLVGFFPFFFFFLSLFPSKGAWDRVRAWAGERARQGAMDMRTGLADLTQASRDGHGALLFVVHIL